jgi:hypothetical protein
MGIGRVLILVAGGEEGEVRGQEVSGEEVREADGEG